MSTAVTTDFEILRSFWSDVHISTFGFSLLSGLALGTIAAGNVAIPGSSLFWSCIGTGGIAGGLTGPLLEKLVADIKYPARHYRTLPILNSSFTYNSKEIIDDIVARELEQTFWYKAWGGKRDLHALCKKGVCLGVLATLARLMREHHNLSSRDLLTLLHTPENRRSVLYHQCVEFILGDLENLRDRTKNLRHLLEWLEGKKATGYLDAKASIRLNLESEKKFIASLSLATLSRVYGITTFEKGGWGHGFFVQFDEHFRFCDTYNSETGLYEFPSQKLLLSYLYKQLNSYGAIVKVRLYPYFF